MNILEQKPIPLVEIKSYVQDFEEKKALELYLKKFTKLDKKKTQSLSKEVEDLKNLKIKQENIVKISDFLPKTQEEVNKIFTDVSLSEEEINAIIEIVSKY